MEKNNQLSFVKGTLSTPDMLCPWITDRSVFTSKPAEPRIDDVEKIMVAKIQSDCDMTNPVSSSGWRMNDLDVMQATGDQRLQNLLIARAQDTSLNNYLPEGLSDEDLADSVIPRNLDISTLNSLSNELDFIREHVRQSKSRVDTPTPISGSSPSPETDKTD
ncbi:hypothetical protein [Tortoise microvirus 56]|nr:hypothetical protein [Tortoise microvirus 56]